MKKVFILVLFPILAYGQSDTDGKMPPESVLYAEEKQFYVVLDQDCKIKLDSVMLVAFDPEWVKELRIVTDEKYTGIFGNTPIKTDLIYPKRKYIKKIHDFLEIYKKEEIFD
ncbi:hypothetical protein [Belliella pelovolcani]|uniref:Uncharacterized protein n=1 Tax=Belliella pelovolcani TaxID=529505 RepID=A0A1N7LAP4_9BACT|nr:hypothetical protein [Belliella pelovolcani]SIS70936.1 hypothetical protein SAMN05421761_103179 [Belliella pelovolcani]